MTSNGVQCHVGLEDKCDLKIFKFLVCFLINVDFLMKVVLSVKPRQGLTLHFWRNNVDWMLEFNDQRGSGWPRFGQPGGDEAYRRARYEPFEQNGRSAEALEADVQDLKEIERLEQRLKKNEP